MTISHKEVKKWGNSLGLIIPESLVKKEGIKLQDEVMVDIRKKQDIMKLFGSLKMKKSSQALKDEGRALWET